MIDGQFGSFEDFKTKMAASTVAVQGSGWGWVVRHKMEDLAISPGLSLFFSLSLFLSLSRSFSLSLSLSLLFCVSLSLSLSLISLNIFLFIHFCSCVFPQGYNRGTKRLEIATLPNQDPLEASTG